MLKVSGKFQIFGLECVGVKWFLHFLRKWQDGSVPNFFQGLEE